MRHSFFHKESFSISLVLHGLLFLIFWQSFSGFQSKRVPLEIQMIKSKSPAAPPVKSAEPTQLPIPKVANPDAIPITPKPTQKSTANVPSESQKNAQPVPAVFPGDQDKPSILKKIPVQYPKSAQNEELEGEVVVKVTISKTGAVTATEIIKSSGHQLLDESFLKSIKSYQFSAKQIRGVKEDGTLTLTHRFSLEQ